jgi:hypothetical protein
MRTELRYPVDKPEIPWLGVFKEDGENFKPKETGFIVYPEVG